MASLPEATVVGSRVVENQLCSLIRPLQLASLLPPPRFPLVLPYYSFETVFQLLNPFTSTYAVRSSV